MDALHPKLLEGYLDGMDDFKAGREHNKDFPKGISQCGSDALGFALFAYAIGGTSRPSLPSDLKLIIYAPGCEMNLEIIRVEGYGRFCIKIWDATKFARPIWTKALFQKRGC